MTVHFERSNRRFLTGVLLAVFTFINAPLQALEIPPDVEQAFEKATVTEDDMLNGPGNTRLILMEYMKTNWIAVFDHLEEVAPTRKKKAILIRAAESLEAQEYFTFLKKMKEFRETGRLSPEEFDDVIFPSRYRKDFLPYNYQNPEVRAFVESVRPLVTDRHQNGIAKFLTGETKKNREEIGTANGEGEFDSSLLLIPTAATAPRKKPSRSPPENNASRNSSAITNPLDNAGHVTADNKPTKRHRLLWIVLFIAIIFFSRLLLRRFQKRK